MFTDRRRVLGLMAGSFATSAFAQAPAMTRITGTISRCRPATKAATEHSEIEQRITQRGGRLAAVAPGAKNVTPKPRDASSAARLALMAMVLCTAGRSFICASWRRRFG